MKRTVVKIISLILLLTYAVIGFAGCESAVNEVLFVKSSADYEFTDGSAIQGNAGQLVESDVKIINECLKKEYPDKEIDVVPVYSTDANIFMNDEIIRIYAIDPMYASSLGLEEMADGTAYFAAEQSDKIELEISVITEIEENGIICGDVAHKTLNAQSGIAENSLLSVLKDKYFVSGMLEETVCFVTTNTFAEIAELACVAENPGKSGSVFNVTEIIGICIYAEDSKAVGEYLTELKYFVK